MIEGIHLKPAKRFIDPLLGLAQPVIANRQYEALKMDERPLRLSSYMSANASLLDGARGSVEACSGATSTADRRVTLPYSRSQRRP